MPAQIRIYTINRGQMDAFLNHFQTEVRPMHQKVGYEIVSAWVNRPQNEFIWVRAHKDDADRDAKGAAFREACNAAGIKLGENVAKMEVREVEAL